jgi:hypothetical protein
MSQVVEYIISHCNKCEVPELQRGVQRRLAVVVAVLPTDDFSKALSFILVAVPAILHPTSAAQAHIIPTALLYLITQHCYIISTTLLLFIQHHTNVSDAYSNCGVVRAVLCVVRAVTKTLRLFK